ncbi:hypothetical protein WN944_023398 [Citrus x changshan-huyou]|uniref:Uncharacterized protein n=1 Tax=Citrus x changshan-huyou TaxID=2935761 RepID=A0AAP0R158_9ROSI
MVSRFAAVEDLGSLAPIKKKKASRVYECSYKVNWLQTYGWWGFVKVKFRWYNLLLPISICSSCTSQYGYCDSVSRAREIFDELSKSGKEMKVSTPECDA